MTKSYDCLKYLFNNDDTSHAEAVKRLLNEKMKPTLETPLHLTTLLPMPAFSRLLLRYGAGRSLFNTNISGIMPGK